MTQNMFIPQINIEIFFSLSKAPSFLVFGKHRNALKTKNIFRQVALHVIGPDLHTDAEAHWIQQLTDIIWEMY